MQGLPNLVAYVDDNLSSYDELYFKATSVVDDRIQTIEEAPMKRFRSDFLPEATYMPMHPVMNDFNNFPIFPFYAPMNMAGYAELCHPHGGALLPPPIHPLAHTASAINRVEVANVISMPPSPHWSKSHDIERSDHGKQASEDTQVRIRRTRGDCRYCPCRENGKRISRVTTFKCKECKTFLHPECFMLYHRRKFDHVG